jgi:hypothetical protein
MLSLELAPTRMKAFGRMAAIAFALRSYEPRLTRTFKIQAIDGPGGGKRLQNALLSPVLLESISTRKRHVRYRKI